MARAPHWKTALSAFITYGVTGCTDLERAHQSQVSVKSLRDASIAQYGPHVVRPCNHHPSDSNDYIFKTCEALVAKSEQALTHPNTWNISKTSEEELFGKTVTAVHFSCCGPGYMAFFDEQGNFIAFRRKKDNE